MAKKKRKVSAATKRRLKAMRKKFGLGEFKKGASRSKKKKSRRFIRTKTVTRSMPRRKSRKGSRKGKHGDLIKLAVMGAGAGFSGFIGAKVTEFSGGKLEGNTAQLAAGAAMYFFGRKIHPLVRTAGAGVLVKAVGDYVEDNVVPQVSSAVSKKTTTSNTEEPII